MVHAVDRYLLLPEDMAQARALLSAYLVNQRITRKAARRREVIVLQSMGKVTAQILIKTAAGGHVDHLNAAANAQYRLAVLHGPVQQFHLGPIACRVGLATQGVPFLSVAARLYIQATGQEHAVQASKD